MRRESVVECIFSEASVRVVLASHSLVSTLSQRLLVEVPLCPRRHSSESHGRGCIVAELSLDFAHVLDLVWVCVGAWAKRLIVLDPEVDTLDRVFAREHSDLVGGWVLEARR